MVVVVVVVAAAAAVMVVVGVRTYVAETCYADLSGLTLLLLSFFRTLQLLKNIPEVCRLSMRYFKI